MENVIEAKELRRSFNGLEAVSGASFSVKAGELFAFLGPNGAGKTTTIKMLCTLLRPDSGQAWVNGFEVSSHPHEVRRSIGIVFQDPSLDERLTVEENLLFHAALYRMPKEKRRPRLKVVLEMTGLEERSQSLVRTLSGGMKRRLEIARGLLHEPVILFLDEPTIGLDPQTRTRIWQHLADLKKSTGVTVFMTTHYMEEAEFCDRVAVMDYGRLVALDTPESLKKQAEASSMNEVFLKLTGHDIREEEGGPQEILRGIVRSRKGGL